MDFIERLLGISPDGGSGATELVILLGAMLMVLVLSYSRRQRADGVRDERPDTR